MSPEDCSAALVLFASEAFDWYRYEEDLPAPRDLQVMEAVDGYLATDDEHRNALSEAVDAYSGHTLASFAERGCSWALHTNDARHLQRAVAAVAWQWQGCEDPCDGIAVLGAVYDATQRLKLDPAVIFGFGADHAPVAIKSAFPDFLSREDLHEIAAVMGYVLKPTPGGLRYLRTW